MYLHGEISVDPSSLTSIELVKPSKAFGKMLHVLTLGLASEKEERETFTAVSVLQQFNQVFRSLGITNVVRLARDDVDFYLDEEGREDDLKEAMVAFVEGASDEPQDQFQTLWLVLEAEDDVLKYLVQVEINAVHKVGMHPIRITVNGLIKELHLDADQPDEKVRELLDPHFVDQDAYDAVAQTNGDHFGEFVERLASAIGQKMNIDDLSTTLENRIIRPGEPITSRQQWSRNRGASDPVYHGYYGYDDYFWYSWTWSEMCHENNVHCHDCSVVDDQGRTVFEVQSDGFDAGESNVLNPAEPIEVPSDGDVSVSDDHAFSDSPDFSAAADTSGGGDSGGWLGSLCDGFSDGGSDGGASCGSSCGSSCGGGCGG